MAKGGKLLHRARRRPTSWSARARPRSTTSGCRRRWGPAEVDTFVRFYEVPGYGHAASSTFNAAWDSLTALENWVEKGTAPTAQVVTDTAGVAGRTRPLCDYPKWAQYNGTGDVNLAASFTCVVLETVPGDAAPDGVRHRGRQRRLGHQRDLRLEGRAVREAAGRRPALERRRSTRRVDLAKSTQQFGNACVQSGRLYGPGLNNKYDPTIGTSLGQTVGSEDCLYLNIWRPAGAATQSAGDRLGARRQQHLRLHRRSDVRRRAPRADRQRRRRLGELSPRHVRLPQHGAAEDRRRAERLGRLRDPRHHQGAAVRQRQHRQLRRRSRQRHADGPVGRRGRRLRGDDLAARRQRQPVAGASPAADQRRHLARRRAAGRQHRDAGAGVGVRAGRPPCCCSSS